MQDLLLEMMNQGFVVYSDGDQFALQKLETPASPNRLFDGDKLCQHFPSLAEALTKAEELIGYTKKQQTPADFMWEPELMYKHRGERLPRIIPLGLIGNASKDVAEEIAKDSGRLWIEAKFKPDEIESWEVRVRPAKR